MSPPAAPRPRVTVLDDGPRLVLRFHRPRGPRLVLGLFLGSWAVGWAGAGAGLVAMLRAAGEQRAAATSAGMGAVLWLLGAAFVAWAFFRAVLSAEVVEVDGPALTVRHVAGPLRPGTAYELARIRNLRLEPGAARRTSFAFEHGGSTVRFGSGLDGPEAEAVLAALSARLPAPR
jgi:hypothetical protein